jgi:hypothetical protein
MKTKFLSKQVYEHIISLRGGPVEYEYSVSANLKLRNHPYPWSIIAAEFDTLYNIITMNNLKRGYEACTGVGISGLAAALAMKETGGKVVSLDCYVEEHNNYWTYTDEKFNSEKTKVTDSDGYKSVFYLREIFGVQDQFIPEIGWTPDDVPATLEKHYTESLDYVFIDGGHLPEQVIADITAVLPYTNKETIWTFHDCFPQVWTNDVAEFCKNNLGGELKIICPASKGASNLGILVNHHFDYLVMI